MIDMINKLYYVFLFMINFLTSYIYYDENLIFILISLDNIYVAIDFFSYFYNSKINEKTIINNNNSLYNQSTVERYFYYFFINIIYFIITFIIFNKDIMILKQILLLSTIPMIFNNIISVYLNNMFVKIKNEKSLLINTIYYEQLSYLINKILIIYLDKNINKDETIILLSKIQNNKLIFLKNIIIVIILKSLKKYSETTYKFIKTIYEYYYDEDIKNITQDESYILLKIMIETKKYENIIRPLYIQALYNLLTNDSSINNSYNYLNKLHFKFLTSLMLWSIGSIFSIYILLLSIIIISYVKNKSINVIQLSVLLLLSYIINNILIISFISQFIEILFSPIIYKNIILVKNWFVNNIIVFNDYTVYYKYIYIISNYILLTNDVKYTNIILCLLIFNILSGKNILNIIFENIYYFNYLYLILYITIMNNDEYYKIILIGFILGFIENYIYYNNKNKQNIINNCDNLLIDDSENVILIDVKPTIIKELEKQNIFDEFNSINISDKNIKENYF